MDIGLQNFWSPIINERNNCMNIKYLGTAAAEGIPGLFCDCKNCVEARKRGGRNIRTRSQALIDGKILIDFNADTYMHTINNNIDMTKIQDCLVTHLHEDHFYFAELKMREPGFSNIGKDRPFKVYTVYQNALKINGYINSFTLEDANAFEVNPIELYKTFKIGDYKVTALKAVHDVYSCPVIYLIEDIEKKRLLYAHDTHYFCDEVWSYLEKNKIKLDFVSLDCTQANDPQMGYIGHMNLNDNIKVKNRLIDSGCADEKTIFCVNHFAHGATDVLYDDFSVIAEKSGILTSYDGMSVDF